MTYYHHGFDSVALYLGPFPIRWYGLMYLLGISIAWFLGCHRIKNRQNRHLTINQDEFTDVIIYMVFGLLVGGRLGYMLFYQFAAFAAKPWQIFMLWQGGMSFHGGLIGATLGIVTFCYMKKQDFFVLTDFIAPLTPPAFFFGRIGNFINGELWGKVTDVPWAVVFPTGGPFPRHPSQLYEGVLEGLVLFFILWFFTKQERPRMAASGLFCLGYGTFRSLVEFCRVPDQHLGYLAFDWLTMGQLLSLPLIIIGICLLVLAYSRNHNITYSYK